VGTVTKPTPAGRDDQLVRDITPVVARALANGRRHTRPLQRNPAMWLAAAAVALVVAAFVVGFVIISDSNDKVQTLSGQVRDLGGTPFATPSAGARGEKGDTGPSGASGASGLDGRGIITSAIVNNHLVLTYTSGTRLDVGRVVGPKGATGASGSPGASGPAGASGASGTGKPGSDGADGRGIKSTDINSAGHLAVTYTDGTTADLGAVVGPAGQNGSDGADGKSGAAGSPPASFTFTVPGVLGDTTYLCTPDGESGPGAQPSYSCAAQPTSTPSGTETP
jgi:hypothetical protein